MKKILIQSLITIAVTTNTFAQTINQKDVLLPAQGTKIAPKLNLAEAASVSPNTLIADVPKMCATMDVPSSGNSGGSAIRTNDSGVSVNTQPLIGQTDLFWPNGSIIRVKLIGGSTLIRFKIIQYALEWTRYVNIVFRFTEDNNADINVNINADGSSWSRIGTQHRGSGGVPTMNFGWFTDATPENEFKRVVLHEFGHALGFLHEQGHPDANIPWDREAVYTYYGRPPNRWSRTQVDFNVFERYNRKQTQSSNYDRSSIMQYAVSNAVTIGDFEIPWNTTLSPTDIEFAGVIYPRTTNRVNKLRITIKTGGDDLRINSQAKLMVQLISAGVSLLELPINGGQSYGNGSTNTVEINLPHNVNLSNILRCRLSFNSGRQLPFDSPDNWKIDQLKLEWVEPNRNDIQLFSAGGTPFIIINNETSLVLFSH